MSTAPQPMPYFGRAWSVTVTPQGGGSPVSIASQGATPSLRVVFSINTMMLMVAWEASVSIYNLSASTANTIGGNSAQSQLGQGLSLTDAIVQGDQVSISAGYAPFSGGSAFSPSSNLIYTGNILQSIATRENVVDTKLTLRCLSNLAVVSFGSVNFARSKSDTDLDVLNQIITNAGMKIDQIDSASAQALQNQTYPRGQAIYGRPYPLIADIAKQHSIFSWVDPQNGLNMRTFNSSGITPKYVYGPPNFKNQPNNVPTGSTIKPTILGVPEQTQNGVTFRVLMDPQLKLYDPIQIAGNTAINGYQFNYGSLPPLPNASGVYLVGGIRHVGDSRGRGDDWYTEITALTPQFFSAYFAARKP